MMNCQEYKEIVAAHVDGALSSEERLAAETHLSRCPKCGQMFLWETEAKKSLGLRLTLLPARPGLKERLSEQLEKTSKNEFLSWITVPHRLAVAFALSLIVIVPYLIWQGKVQEDIFTDAIAQYRKVTQGIAEAPQAVSSLTPAARLLDLSPWGYQVLARQTQQVRGQKGRLFVYQGREKDLLLAQEFDGADFSPPPGARIIRASNREFAIYSQEQINLIAFKDKDVLCILSATLPKEKLLGLAQQLVMAN